MTEDLANFHARALRMPANTTAAKSGAWFSSLPWKAKIPLIFGPPIVVFLAVTALLNLYNYSVGTRTGVISKLSTKGVACWTNEGQLALPNFTSGGPRGNVNIDNTFAFSVPDQAVWKKLQAMPSGGPVTLEYRQKLFSLAWPVPFFCLRKTEYEIVGARPAPAFEMQAPVRP
ncbi:MAG: hypothetical protein ACR652_26110 [Methylocystis sp.]|uniref:hypothetical protein n=1 Tax=Methylocystis sp. TaxID=1911079 RepID=UPI003DA5EA38